MLLVELGRDVRIARIARGCSQADVALIAGVSSDTIARLELGLESNIGVKEFGAILAAVGLELRSGDAGALSKRLPYIRRAVSAANVCCSTRLYPDDLVVALATGSADERITGLVASALFDMSGENLAGIIDEVSSLGFEREVVARHVALFSARTDPA